MNIVPIKNADAAGLLDGLLAFWKMDDTSGNLTDVHGSHTATATDLTYSETGIVNTACGFNGTSAFASVVTTDFDALTSITVSLWCRPAAIATQYLRVFHKGDSTGATTGFHITQTSGAVMCCGFEAPGEWDGGNYSPYNTNGGSFGVLSNATYYHLAFTYDSYDKIKIYRNGARYYSAYTIIAWSSGTGNNFAIGKKAGTDTYYYSGLLDEIGVWNRALSGAEISTLYGGGSGLAYSSFT